VSAPRRHRHKRDEVADVAAGLIERAGLAALTVREVAAAAGCSTTVVTHYFADKSELLLHTYRLVANRAQRRIDRVLEADPLDLQGWCEALLPVDDLRRRDCKVWFAFWHAASDDATYAAEQRYWVQHSRRVLRGILAKRGYPRAAATARHLLALLMGVAVQAVFDADDWPRARQIAFFRDEIRRLDALR